MVKTITIREEVYMRLVAVKKENESFSKLFDRLIQREGHIGALERLRGSVNFINKKKMLSELRVGRSGRKI